MTWLGYPLPRHASGREKVTPEAACRCEVKLVPNHWLIALLELMCNKLTTRTHGQGVSACLRCMRIINHMVADLVYSMDGFMGNGSGLVPSTVYPKPNKPRLLLLLLRDCYICWSCWVLSIRIHKSCFLFVVLTLTHTSTTTHLSSTSNIFAKLGLMKLKICRHTTSRYYYRFVSFF